jgi:hypothetical protein
MSLSEKIRDSIDEIINTKFAKLSINDVDGNVQLFARVYSRGLVSRLINCTSAEKLEKYKKTMNEMLAVYPASATHSHFTFRRIMQKESEGSIAQNKANFNFEDPPPILTAHGNVKKEYLYFGINCGEYTFPLWCDIHAKTSNVNEITLQPPWSLSGSEKFNATDKLIQAATFNNSNSTIFSKVINNNIIIYTSLVPIGGGARPQSPPAGPPVEGGSANGDGGDGEKGGDSGGECNVNNEASDNSEIVDNDKKTKKQKCKVFIEYPATVIKDLQVLANKLNKPIVSGII